MQDARDATALRAWMESFMTRSFGALWRYARKAGLSMPQLGLMRQLYHKGDCEVHEVGKHFDVTSAAASQLVDRLVQAGYVERTEDPQDRRARRVALTAKGRAVLEKGIEESYGWVDDLLAALPARTRAALRDVIAELSAAEAALPAPDGTGAWDGARGAPRGAIRAAR